MCLFPRRQYCLNFNSQYSHLILSYACAFSYLDTKSFKCSPKGSLWSWRNAQLTCHFQRAVQCLFLTNFLPAHHTSGYISFQLVNFLNTLFFSLWKTMMLHIILWVQLLEFFSTDLLKGRETYLQRNINFLSIFSRSPHSDKYINKW